MPSYFPDSTHPLKGKMEPVKDKLLEIPLPSPFDDLTKHRIAHAFWEIDLEKYATPKNSNPLQRYCKYYTNQSDLALHDVGRHATVRTHQDVISVASFLKQGLEKHQIVRLLRNTPLTCKVEDVDAAVETSINLAARLLLMIEIGCIHRGFSGRRELVWKEGSIQGFVSDLFRPTDCPLERVKLEKIFVARNLSRIARIGVVWTDDLAEHLQTREHDTQVAIFHHASFLKIVQHR